MQPRVAAMAKDMEASKVEDGISLGTCGQHHLTLCMAPITQLLMVARVLMLMAKAKEARAKVAMAMPSLSKTAMQVAPVGQKKPMPPCMAHRHLLDLAKATLGRSE